MGLRTLIRTLVRHYTTSLNKLLNPLEPFDHRGASRVILELRSQLRLHLQDVPSFWESSRKIGFCSLGFKGVWGSGFSSEY